MIEIGFTDTELRIVRSALHSYLTDFGHEEADVRRQVRDLLTKIEATSAASSGAGDSRAH